MPRDCLRHEPWRGPESRDVCWLRMVAAAQDSNARAYDALLYDRLPLLRAIGCRCLREAAWLEDAKKNRWFA